MQLSVNSFTLSGAQLLMSAFVKIWESQSNVPFLTQIIHVIKSTKEPTLKYFHIYFLQKIKRACTELFFKVTEVEQKMMYV